MSQHVVKQFMGSEKALLWESPLLDANDRCNVSERRLNPLVLYKIEFKRQTFKDVRMLSEDGHT